MVLYSYGLYSFGPAVFEYPAADATGESYVMRLRAVPMTLPTVNARLLITDRLAGLAQRCDVSEIHDVVRHGADAGGPGAARWPWMRLEGVMLRVPKLRPDTVSTAWPDVGELGRDTDDATGGSVVNMAVTVPRLAPTVTSTVPEYAS